MNIEAVNAAIAASTKGYMGSVEPIQSVFHPLHKDAHWELIEDPLKDFGVTIDLDEWLLACISQRNPDNEDFLLTRKELLRRLNALDIQPTGFMLHPVCHLNGKVLKAKTRVQKDIHESPYGEYYLYTFGREKVLTQELKKTTSYRIRYSTLE